MLEQQELEQHLDALTAVSRGIGAEVVEALAGALEGATHIGEHRPMAGDHQVDLEFADAIEDGALLGKARLAFELRKDHAEAVFPECIGRDQDAGRLAVEHHRLRVVPWRGDRLPWQSAKFDHLTINQHIVEGELFAALTGRPEAQGLRIPIAHRLRTGHRNDRATAIGPLQDGIAAAVVRVQMRVDQQFEPALAKRMPDDRQRHVGMFDVAGVDQGGVMPVVKEHTVGRQPVALDEPHRGRQRRRSMGRLRGHGDSARAALNAVGQGDGTLHDR